MMRLLATTAGTMPAKEKADYIMNIAKRLNADVAALHISDYDHKMDGEAALKIFEDSAKRAHVKLIKVIQSGEIVPTIIETSVRVGADLIVMGASQGKVVNEWVGSDVIEKSKIPVVVIPHAFILVHKE